MADPPKVFISYSHDDDRHQERVLQLANRLRLDWIDAEIDEFETSPPEGWPAWCERQIEQAAYVLMICTDTYLRRVQGEDQPGAGLGVLWEARIIRQIMYDGGSASQKLIPVLFSGCSLEHIPRLVRGATHYKVDDDGQYERLKRHLKNEPKNIKLPLGAAALEIKTPKGQASEAAARALEVYEYVSFPLRGRGQQPKPAPARSLSSPEMVQLPAGTFMMGSPETERDRDSNEGPQHHVHIGYRFELGAYPITFDEYDYFCEETGREKPGDHGWGRGRRPVVFISWFDAVAYCEWLSKETKETKQLFRLPTEAEWEYACRSGTTTRYSFGDVTTPDKANYTDSGHARTTEVDLYPANAWGVFDMHGNADEWVKDVWHDCYEGAPTDGSAWTDEEGSRSTSLRVVRGGSWNNYPFRCRSTCRSRYYPGDRGYHLGFRVARTLG